MEDENDQNVQMSVHTHLFGHRLDFYDGVPSTSWSLSGTTRTALCFRPESGPVEHDRKVGLRTGFPRFRSGTHSKDDCSGEDSQLLSSEDGLFYCTLFDVL